MGIYATPHRFYRFLSRNRCEVIKMDDDEDRLHAGCACAIHPKRRPIRSTTRTCLRAYKLSAHQSNRWKTLTLSSRHRGMPIVVNPKKQHRT